MVVVVIIGILIGLMAPNILGRVDKARVTAAKTDIATLDQALEMYRLDNHAYPSTDQGLEALVVKPSGEPDARNWNPEGYLKKKQLPIDPWGHAYQYVSPGRKGTLTNFIHWVPMGARAARATTRTSATGPRTNSACSACVDSRCWKFSWSSSSSRSWRDCW